MKLKVPLSKHKKPNKSAGCDKIRSEHLKNAQHALIQEITNLLNNTAETGNYPQELSFLSKTIERAIQ